MSGGIVASILVFVVGAILDFAVTASRYQHGFNINTVGMILMIAGAVGFVVSLVALVLSSRHSIDSQVVDNQGHAAEYHQKMS
jgi:hypothetical protein